MTVGIYKNGQLIRDWLTKTEDGGPFNEAEGNSASKLFLIQWTLNLDPIWLRFTNSDNSAYIDELRISWVDKAGQIAELEVAFSGNEPTLATQEKINERVL